MKSVALALSVLFLIGLAVSGRPFIRGFVKELKRQYQTDKFWRERPRRYRR
jgi:hypothetical protein